MKNTFGHSITVTLFGESHGEEIGATLDGIAPGIKIDYEYIDLCLKLRRPYGKISTPRQEPDPVRIISGVYNGYTTGTPLTIIIPNLNKKSSDYKDISHTPRPGHADFTAECKYHGFQDPRGGGHFSGRITAPLVAAGAILRSALKEKGIHVASHISNMRGIVDRDIGCREDVLALEFKPFPTLDDNAALAMQKEIECAASHGDSVGGILETVILGVDAGVGEPFFDSVESEIAHILFSIPGIKGVEFGAGFKAAELFGSEFNDDLTVSDGKIVTSTNNNGGINGGITNGMPIVIRSAVKPTPSIFKAQRTVDLESLEETEIKIEGRHDPSIIHRVREVVDSALAIVIADMLTVRYGTDYLAKTTERT